MFIHFCCGQSAAGYTSNVIPMIFFGDYLLSLCERKLFVVI